MKWAQKLWPWFAFVAVIFMIVRAINESIWLDVTFNFLVAITFTLIAFNLFITNQRKHNWWVICIFGFCVTVFLIEGFINLIAVL